MDEPEKHLHPSSVISLIMQIQKNNANGQLWIATHSISLISFFESQSLWFIDKGKIKNRGRTPEIVLGGLLGESERITRLRHFIDLPSKLATSRFAFECLTPPSVAITNSTDKQSNQIYQNLKKLGIGNNPLSVLDFGAGKGRILANLHELNANDEINLDYYAYDPSESDRAICSNNIELVYGSKSKNRHFDTIEGIREILGLRHFDVVVLCNVLHEIPHLKWIETFSDIESVLKNSGKLLVIEDCRIPTGELPHPNGFLVLETSQLKELFGITEDPEFIVTDYHKGDPDRENRLMAHLIPSRYLPNVSLDSIQSAIELAKHDAIDKIRSARHADASKLNYFDGLKHGFYLQQLANSILCLEPHNPMSPP